MDHNLIPLFIMRDGGVIINNSPKINCEDPIVDDVSVSFDQSDLQITLRLNVVFLCFYTRVPTETEQHERENFFLTSD